jgi:hypothetical protein
MSVTEAQLRALVAQVATIKEQATAIGMQAETADRTLQAVLATLPRPEPAPKSAPGAPAGRRYLNGFGAEQPTPP